jgi:hypothetical protein
MKQKAFGRKMLSPNRGNGHLVYKKKLRKTMKPSDRTGRVAGEG